MGSTIKKIILSICIIFSVLCIVNIIYNDICIGSIINNININNHNEITPIQVNGLGEDLIKLNYYNGMLNELNQLKIIFVESCVMGILIGLILSISEYPKIKHIMYYITGSILINTILGIVYKGSFMKNGIDITMFVSILECFKRTIIIYTFCFIIIEIVVLLDKKIEIKELNKIVKNK